MAWWSATICKRNLSQGTIEHRLKSINFVKIIHQKTIENGLLALTHNYKHTHTYARARARARARREHTNRLHTHTEGHAYANKSLHTPNPTRYTPPHTHTHKLKHMSSEKHHDTNYPTPKLGRGDSKGWESQSNNGYRCRGRPYKLTPSIFAISMERALCVNKYSIILEAEFIILSTCSNTSSLWISYYQDTVFFWWSWIRDTIATAASRLNYVRSY